MAFLRIHCDVCGGAWEVYGRDNWKDDKARQCPHCFSKIDRTVWQKEVLPAFGAVQDANAELYKEHTGYHTPLFSFDVLADHIYKNKDSGESCPFKNELQAFEDFLNT